MSIDDKEGTRRFKQLMAELGPITGTEEERRAEGLRRLELAHEITPEEVAEMKMSHEEAWARLTDEERANVVQIEAEVSDIRAAVAEKDRDKPTIQ